MSSAGSQSAAFFDVDGTLLRGFITQAFPRYLAERGLFPEMVADEIDRIVEAYEGGRIAYREAAETVPVLIASALRGRQAAKIETIAGSFMADYVPKHEYSYARPLVQWLRERVDLTLAVSGSPIEPVSELSPFGFDELYGTLFERRDGTYTGRVKLNLILSESKAGLIDRLTADKHVDLSRSYAFGDTDQDSPVLERVRWPLALNPNAALLRTCQEQGWPWLTRKELSQPWENVRVLIAEKLGLSPV
ncbi:MAG: HAD-IB family hydrolase [Candidatus Bathyarchaeia archaeon]